jgi:hypothetical protein
MARVMEQLLNRYSPDSSRFQPKSAPTDGPLTSLRRRRASWKSNRADYCSTERRKGIYFPSSRRIFPPGFAKTRDKRTAHAFICAVNAPAHLSSIAAWAAGRASQCRCWVIRDQFGTFAQSPLYPQHRTSAKRAGTSVSCQDRKSQFLFNQVRVPAPDHTSRRSANRPRQMIELDVLHSRAEQVGGYGKG